MAAAIAWSARSGSSRICASIREPGVFIVDDVAFMQEGTGWRSARRLPRRHRKKYYLETRGDVLLRNKECSGSGSGSASSTCSSASRRSMRRGCEISQARLARPEFRGGRIRSLARHQCRDQFDRRSRLGSRRGSRSVREWCLDVPEIVNISVNTPYPGDRELADRGASLQPAIIACSISSMRCCRQNCRSEFYRELVTTQQAIYSKHLDWRRCADASGLLAGCCSRARRISSTAFSNSTASTTRAAARRSRRSRGLPNSAATKGR